ncbi:MAG: hypothetical protein A3K68_04345 [Euryarchaeota archaeon RBG_16_68_13]|nr:MAG: hypothetical protein A3K68_04345 [Euryarchaeota archaeon RBG_16_68_13]
MSTRTSCGLFVLALVLLAGMPFLGSAAAVTIGPGVVFQPSGSWANISFATTQTFGSVRVDATGVTFDGVRLGVAKVPQGLPRAVLVISTWTPLQTVANASVLRFAGDALPGSNLSFSLSGVIPAREYALQVDGAEDRRVFSDSTGFVAFSWANFSIHDFHVVLGWRTGTPPPPPALSADFTFAPTSPSESEVVTFSATAAGGVPPYAYTWDFGDGFGGPGSGTGHAYATAGTYTVNLTVTDARDGAAWAEKSIIVQGGPPPPTLTANFTFAPANPYAGDAVSFTSAASGGTPPYEYHWDFDDGAVGVGTEPVHVFAAAGTYNVTLTVSDTRPVDVLVVHPVVVRTRPPPPLIGNVTAAFDFTLSGTTVTFLDRSTTDTGAPIATWFWAFGDGTSSEDPSPTHTYNVTGLSATFTVVLVACASPESCDSTSREITFYNVGLIALLGGVSAAVLVAGVLLLLLRRRRRKAHDVPVLENNPDAEIADAPPRRRGGNR